MARCDSYDFGECTAYACAAAGYIPDGLGNATDWLADARARGLETVESAFPGAVVVYAAGGGYSEFGHVAVVTSVVDSLRFWVTEMNFVAWDTVDSRLSTYADVEGFILPPGGVPSPVAGGVPGSLQRSRDALARLSGALSEHWPWYYQEFMNAAGKAATVADGQGL